MTKAAAREALAMAREAIEWSKRQPNFGIAEQTRCAWIALIADLEKIAGTADPALLPSVAFRDESRRAG